MATARARTDSAKAERRHVIIGATAVLIGARGVNAVSMQDIANACNLTKPALYNYFTTREEIILAVYRTLLSEWLATFNRSLLAAGHPLPRASFDRIFVSCFSEQPLLCHLINHLTATIAPRLPTATAEHLRLEMSEQLAGLRDLLLHYGYGDDATAADLARAYHTVLVGAAQIAAPPSASWPDEDNRTGMTGRTGFETACLATLGCLR